MAPATVTMRITSVESRRSIWVSFAVAGYRSPGSFPAQFPEFPAALSVVPRLGLERGCRQRGRELGDCCQHLAPMPD